MAESYALEAHHEQLLARACESLDRMRQAQAELERDGLTLESARGGRRAHPCVSIERDSRIAFIRALAELKLDYAPVSGHQQTAAARASRWR